MAKYVVILKDKRPAALTREIYYAHVAHVQTLTRSGKLFLAGPLVGQDRVLQVLETASLAEADALVRADPYVSRQYYGDYDVCELLEANAANNWLMDTPRIQELLRNLP